MPSFPIFDALDPLNLEGKLNDPLPLGPPGEVLHGRLGNGLTYYVREGKKPAGRAAICLAVRIGSAVEEEHERGVAHILEHLAFNATEVCCEKRIATVQWLSGIMTRTNNISGMSLPLQRYQNHDIIKFMEKIGAQFGACQNATTSVDETVYTLEVPTDEEGLLEQSIQVLAEFAFGIRYETLDHICPLFVAFSQQYHQLADSHSGAHLRI